MGLNVVLVEPEIPWNTGNIGRTCVAAGATLHLVGRLGFSLSAREIRRSGLDYWPKLRLRLHADFEAFEAALPAGARLILFDPRAERSLWRARLGPHCYLVFGSESRGFSPEIRRHRSSLPHPHGGGRPWTFHLPGPALRGPPALGP